MTLQTIVLKQFILLFLCVIVITTILTAFLMTDLDLKVIEIEFNTRPFDTKARKINWTNYTAILLEKQRKGLGEHGKPVFVTDDDENDLVDSLINEYSYNAIVSDKISLDRSVPDTRLSACRSIKYRRDLPAISVVIVFHDEHLSVLLRTIHSVINRTPEELLKEIILVDDDSTKIFLKTPLDDHISSYYKHQVRILRLNKRHGLIKARLEGISNTTSDIVVVMDAHIEVNTNWLPPLIEPIVEDYTTMTEPIFDAIYSNTFQYAGHPIKIRTKGGINWRLLYVQYPRKLKPNESLHENYEVPVILGATFAVNKTWFLQLGGYDKELIIWGGEQIESSWKMWMCGGKIIKVACSHVGHNYKSEGHHPYALNASNIWHNLNRIAEIWMDEYKEEYYFQTGSRNIEFGNVNEQIRLRKKLKCKSFKWYLNHILPEIFTEYPIDMSLMQAHGAIQSMIQHKNYCCTRTTGNQIGIWSCDNFTNPGRNQYFVLTKNDEIRLKSSKLCWNKIMEKNNKLKYKVLMNQCDQLKKIQKFFYDKVTQQIVSDKFCLELDNSDIENPIVYFTSCVQSRSQQQWKWSYIN